MRNEATDCSLFLADHVNSKQAHLVTHLQCSKQLRGCWNRKPRGWSPRVACIRLVRSFWSWGLSVISNVIQGSTQHVSAAALLHRLTHRHSHIVAAASKFAHTTFIVQYRRPSQHLRHVPSRRRGRSVPGHQPWFRNCTRRLHVPKHRHLYARHR